LSKLDSSPKRAAVSTPSHDYPKSVFIRRRPRLTVKAVAGDNERDFDHGSTLRGTRRQTGAVDLPKRAITATIPLCDGGHGWPSGVLKELALFVVMASATPPATVSRG
jgi:hypothetical protein